MTIQAMLDEPTTDKPFEALDEVGCANERLQASLTILSDNIREFVDGTCGQFTGTQQRLLSEQWLLLELIRRALDSNFEIFRRAENALYAARAPQQFATKQNIETEPTIPNHPARPGLSTTV